VVTIKDIAARAGTSVGTVDRILHNRGRFSAETAERVMRIVGEVNYTPNAMARHLSRSRTIRIGVVLPDPSQDSGYWGLLLAGVRRAERELAPFSCLFEYFHFDRYRLGSMRELARELAARRVNALVMAPLQPEPARDLVSSFDQALPVVFVDTNIAECRRTSYIGQDSYRSGQIAARLMKMLDGAGSGGGEAQSHYLIVTPETDNEHLGDRVLGFSEGIGAQHRTVRVGVEDDHDVKRFRETMLDCLSHGPAGVFVVDASSHFMAETLAARSDDARGFARPALIGYDLVPENRRWLEAGVIDVLLTQRPAEQGYRAARILFRQMYFDEPCPTDIRTPIEIVLKENAQFMTGGWE